MRTFFAKIARKYKHLTSRGLWGMRYRIGWERAPHLLQTQSFSLLRKKPVDRPVFLLGTQSGGLTLIARTLRRHQDTVYCSGNRYFWAGRDEMQNVGWDYLHPQARLRNRGADMDLKSDFGDYASQLYACDALVDKFRVSKKDISPEAVDSLRKLVSKYVSTYGLGIRRPRFIDKSQSFSIKVPLILEAFPDAKFVLVSRNPYAFAFGRSRQQHVQAAEDKFGFQSSPKQLLQLRAEHWRNTFAIALESLRGHEFLQLRLEDFLEDPAGRLGELMEFIGLSDSPQAILPKSDDFFPPGSVSTTKWFPLETSPNEKYLAQLPARSLKEISPIVQTMAEHFGYELPSSDI